MLKKLIESIIEVNQARAQMYRRFSALGAAAELWLHTTEQMCRRLTDAGLAAERWLHTHEELISAELGLKQMHLERLKSDDDAVEDTSHGSSAQLTRQALDELKDAGVLPPYLHKKMVEQLESEDGE